VRLSGPQPATRRRQRTSPRRTAHPAPTRRLSGRRRRPWLHPDPIRCPLASSAGGLV
jgi:hypothetical protein